MTAPPDSDPADLPPRFEILEHTADLGLRVAGAGAAEVFQTAISALFSLMLTSACSRTTCTRELRLDATGYAELLCDLLNQLLCQFDTEKLIPLALRFDILEPTRLAARIDFGQFDPQVHGVRTYVKAVTYHQLRFETNAEGAVAEFFVDV